MNKSTYKLYPCEVEALVALTSKGYYIALNEKGEDGWEAIWGEDNSLIFSSDKPDEIRSFFSKPFEAYEPHLFAAMSGTHCGMLVFTFGWVHEHKTSTEDLEEAVMPQLYENKVIFVEDDED